MRPLPIKSVAAVVVSASLLLTPALSRAGTNLTTKVNQTGSPGTSWAASVIWQTNGTGTSVAAVAGNTYETLSNGVPLGNGTASTTIRHPYSSGTPNLVTFPGDSLALGTNTQIRFKALSTSGTSPEGLNYAVPTNNFPGVGGQAGLILKGGCLNAGDTSDAYTILGKIQALPGTLSYLNPADTLSGSTTINRGFIIGAQLVGSGNIAVVNALTNIPQKLVCTSNNFTGAWIVKSGWLQGAGNGAGDGYNSAGTNAACSFVIDPQWTPPAIFNANAVFLNGPAVLDMGPAVANSAGTLVLTNGGIMRLHGVAIFSDAVIEGTHLTGTNYYSDLFAAHPANFDDRGAGPNGFGAIIIRPYSTVLPLLPPSIQKQPIDAYAYADGTARFVVNAVDLTGSPLTYQWRSNGVNITSSRFFGATNNILVISNPAPAEAVAYDVVIANPSVSVTSSVAVLNIIAPSGEAYEAAVRAAKPIAFYQLNDTVDPAFGAAVAYDYAGGFYAYYGTGVQNGNMNYGITGPQPADGFPGFGGANAAAQTSLNVANNRITGAISWNLNANAVTITAWVNPNGPQNPNEGLVFCRGGRTVAGLCYASAAGLASLGYNWNNEPDTFNWNSGLTPQPGVWSLVALVVTPTDATIYILNTNATTTSGTIQSSRHVYNHAALAFDVAALIGDDSAGTGGNRSFNGKIDDVGIFNRGLSANDLLTLYSAGSGIPTFGPNIAIQPVSLSLFQGQTAQFTGLAVGSDPLTYQWQSGPGGGPYVNVSGGKFSGATTPTLTIANADFAEQAVYIVIASNGSGSTTSSEAGLTINATNAFAINVTMTNSEPAGNDWDIGATAPGANTNWSDFNPASYSAAQSPGNTYELLPGARLRTPVGPAIASFPGRQLTLDGDGVWRVNPVATDPTSEIRFKQSTYGTTSSGVNGIVNGTVNFTKLIMNGGQLDAGADAGNNANMVTITGEIDILGNTSFNGDGPNDRGFRVDAYLTGTNNIEYHAYNPATFQSNFVNNLNITCPTNTFSGMWNVVAGTLLGTAPGALGTNNIFVQANGALETTYNLTNTSAYLVLSAGAKMFLHQTNRFKSAVISGVSLAPGTNTYATLSTLFPSNFPAIWAPKIGATNYTAASGMIVVLSNAAPLITAQPRSITNRGQQTATFSVTAVGANPLRYQWMAGAVGSGVYTNLVNQPNVSGGVTNATLTITNLSAANAGDYLVVVTNIYGTATSAVARLTDLPIPFITLQPLSQTNSGTLTANFFASALGDLPMTYQWQAGAIGSGGPYTNVNFGPKVTGVNTTNLTISLLAISNSADYVIIFSNFAGSVTSSPATLTVRDPLITQDATPAGTLSRYQTASATWSVGILGTPPLNSQWQGGVAGSGVFTNMVNGPLVSGATSTALTLNSVDFGDAGDYRYIVSNAAGSATSSVVSLTVLASSPAQDYTLNFDTGAGALPIQQPTGNHWDTPNNWNPDGEPASVSAPIRPGSHYHVIGGSRLRPPATNTVFAGGDFTPGIQLIIEGTGVFTNGPGANYTNSAPSSTLMGELRFKHTSPGTNYIKQLVMNGGQLENGDNGLIVIQGEMDVLTNCPIYVDPTGNATRGYRFESWLTGNASVEYHDFDSSFTAGGGLNIAGPTNTYSGTWHVVTGALIGSGPNSLGTNSITVESGGALETTYNLNTPTANLVLNGQRFLHTADTVRTLTIGNYLVPAGTYTYAQLANSFPGNFPGSWNLQTGSTVNMASGSVTVLVGPTINNITNTFSVSGNSLIISGTGGLAYGKYYMLSSTNVALPKASWTRNGPYPFDGLGAYSFSASMTNKQTFFQLQQIVP